MNHKKEITNLEVEPLLRELIQDAFEYKDNKIDGTELGMRQVTCAIAIRELFGHFTRRDRE